MERKTVKIGSHITHVCPANKLWSPELGKCYPQARMERKLNRIDKSAKASPEALLKSNPKGFMAAMEKMGYVLKKK